MRVQLRHLIEQLLVRRRGFLQPIEVLQVTLGVLDRRGRVGRARLLVTGDNSRRVQRRQPVERRDPILSALGRGVADVHSALVIYNVTSDEQGRTDAPDSTSLYVPSIGLIVAGDVVYNQCRIYVGDTTPESRKNWIAALDRLAALNPAIVVAGHKKPGAPDSPSTIQDTKRYLQDFDRLQKAATSDQELFDQMTELYPHWVANQSWLMFGFPQG